MVQEWFGDAYGSGMVHANSGVHFADVSMQFVDGDVQFANSGSHFVDGGMQFVDGDVQFANSGSHFVDGSMQFVDGAVQFANSGVHFVDGGVQFAGVCNLLMVWWSDDLIHVNSTFGVSMHDSGWFRDGSKISFWSDHVYM